MSTDELMIIQIPTGVKVDVKDNVVTAQGSLGTNTRSANTRFLSVAKQGDSVVVEPLKKGKLAKKAMEAEHALGKEIQNDMLGVTKYFEIRMKTVFAHFPMSIEVKGDKLLVNNLIGERCPRVADIRANSKVEVKGADIRVYGVSKDAVSQTAGNIRLACKIRNKDTRAFQDGAYYEIE
jgi:large subunit ribosomal protein L6